MMKRTQPTSHRILRWIFQRGDDLLACGVDQESDHSFTVWRVSNSDVAVVEEAFASGFDALRHHASIAARLRELGFTVTAYTARPSKAEARAA